VLVIRQNLSGEYDGFFILERVRVTMLLPRFRRLSLLLATSAALVPLYYTHAGTTTISGSQTTPVTTNGNDVTISSGASITVTGGAAVTVNSANTVENDGTITGNDGNNMTGILVTTGAYESIGNTGTINITDSTLATSLTLNNGVYSLTKGEHRYAIQIDTAAGAKLFTGNISNSSTGVITVRGNDSAGIFLNSGGINGSIINAGTIGITGNNSFGILVNAGAPLIGSGGIAINNSIDSLGLGSGGVLLNGSMTGQLYVNSTVRSDGYYSGGVITARPATFDGLTAKNMQQAGSSVAVNNSVGGGIRVGTSGTVVTYGAAPALAIMPATGVSATIGPTSTTAGAADLAIDGTVLSNGIFDAVNSTAVQIGGGGGTATLTNGMTIASTGKVDATAFAGNATAVSIGAGANIASLNNAGQITATVKLGAGNNASVGGRAVGIVDFGGALGAINNSGQITATTASGQAVALDLRYDTVPVTVTQSASGTSTPASITGSILFGSQGGDLELNAGTISGNVSYAPSKNNALTINNGGVLGGAVTQAPGGQLNLNVQNGRLASTSTAKLSLSKLTMGSNGQIDFAVNPTSGKNGSLSVLGSILISSGARIGLAIDSQITSPQTLTVIETAGATGALIGQPELLLGNVPYFYDAKIITDPNGGTISVGLRDRPFSQAGVLGSESAYNAVFKDSYNDPGIRDSFTAAGTQPEFARQFAQMLPSYSGGLFEVLAQGADALARTQADTPVMLRGNHGGGWAQQFGFAAVDSTSSSPGYHGGGLGFAFGWEDPITTSSAWGVSVAYMRAAIDDFNTGPNNEEIGTTYTVGAYYRETDGRLHYDASINGGAALLNSTRNFSGTDLTGTEIQRTASSDWTGAVAQAHLGVSYEEQLDDEWFIRPSIAGDYFMLYQGSRSEHNGGSAFDLAIHSATDSQGSVTGAVAVGMQFGDRDFMWRPEVMVGYKEVFGGPDTVLAQFAGGSVFSLNPASQKGGVIGHIGIHGGNKFSDIAIEAGGEDRGDYRAFNGRIVARFQF
jgi:hypothetical protein